MTVVNFSEFKRAKKGEKIAEDKISLEDLEEKLLELHKASKSAGYEEISDLLALVMVATRDVTKRECHQE